MPDYVELRNDAANLYLALGQPRDALRHFEVVVRLQPQSAPAHYNVGVALEASGRAADAAPHYEAALRLDPSYSLAHNNLGNLHLADGRIGEARRETNAPTSDRTTPRRTTIWRGDARIWRRAGRYLICARQSSCAPSSRGAFQPGSRLRIDRSVRPGDSRSHGSPRPGRGGGQGRPARPHSRTDAGLSRGDQTMTRSANLLLLTRRSA